MRKAHCLLCKKLLVLYKFYLTDDCVSKTYDLLTALGVLDTDTTAVSDVTKLFMCAGFVNTGPITSQND